MTQLHSIDELKFSFNPKYQPDYFELRNKIFKESYNLPDYDWGRDQYDNNQDTIYAINKDDKCVAGVRIITRDNHKLLVEEFMNLQQYFDLPTEKELNQVCEFSRLAICENYRSMSLLIKLISLMTEHAKRLKKTKIIYCSTQNKVRMFKGLFKRRLGFSSVENKKLFYYGTKEKMAVTSALTYLN